MLRRLLSSSRGGGAAVFTPQASHPRLPSGFRAAGVAAGVKDASSSKLDVALLTSSSPCAAAAVFTTNRFQAAPVLVSRAVAEAGGVRGVVVNSGCANACTGDRGLADAERMARLGAEAAGGPALVMSTGVIGEFLPMERVERGVREAAEALAPGEEAWRRASEAFMTTDTLPKLVSESFGAYSMAGVSKGSGMIHPNMATMLGVVATDAAVSQECLELALRHANERSFNSITVDGDTSTNDTFAVLANGASGAPLVDDPASPEFELFRGQLTGVAERLAKLIVRDGEGATKFVEVRVRGAATRADARRVAESVAGSSLVKTALFGCDANWGRVVCAVGYSGVPVEPSRVNLWIRDVTGGGGGGGGAGDVHIFRNGVPHADEEAASALMRLQDITLDIELGMGGEECTMYTSDLSYDYVRINGDYRS